jgi:hypothetical protein
MHFPEPFSHGKHRWGLSQRGLANITHSDPSHGKSWCILSLLGLQKTITQKKVSLCLPQPVPKRFYCEICVYFLNTY